MSSNVGNVNGKNPYVAPQPLSTATPKNTKATGHTGKTENYGDKYTPGSTDTQKNYYYTAPSKTNDNSKSHTVDGATLDRMWADANTATAALRNVVMSMLGNSKPGEGVGQAFYAMNANPSKYDIKVDDETRVSAEQMISEDGYYGVKQTTSRIMDFAKALGGENVTADMIDDLRKGAQQGFDDVAKMFGGFDNLPEVTKKTYEAVMKAFDDWKASIASPGAAVETPAAVVEATAAAEADAAVTA